MLSTRPFWCLSLAVFVSFSLTNAHAANPSDIVRVEEDWQLTVVEPDEAALLPQISNAYSPIQDDDVFYGMLSMNHFQGEEEFHAGGIQLQLWYGETLIAERTSEKEDVLLTPNESITWTQEISVQPDGKMTFRIKDGNSETWGSFGQSLFITVQTSLDSLNSYKPSNSLESSGTFYGSNRVSNHKLKRIRVTLRSGEVKIYSLAY